MVVALLRVMLKSKQAYISRISRNTQHKESQVNIRNPPPRTYTLHDSPPPFMAHHMPSIIHPTSGRLEWEFDTEEARLNFFIFIAAKIYIY